MQELGVIMDTCCLINLVSAGKLVELLPPTGWVWYLPRRVESEMLNPQICPGDFCEESHLNDLEGVIGTGSVRRCDIDDDNRLAYLALAAVHGNDADAAALTITESMGGRLATDDKRVTQLARTRNIDTISTAAILRHVSVTMGLNKVQLALMLLRVEKLARWTPHLTDPDSSWWRESRDEAAYRRG